MSDSVEMMYPGQGLTLELSLSRNFAKADPDKKY